MRRVEKFRNLKCNTVVYSTALQIMKRFSSSTLQCRVLEENLFIFISRDLREIQECIDLHYRA